MATKALTTTSLRLCGDLSFCCDPQNSTAAQQLQKTVWEPAKSINKSVWQWDRIPQLDDSTHHRVLRRSNTQMLPFRRPAEGVVTCSRKQVSFMAWQWRHRNGGSAVITYLLAVNVQPKYDVCKQSSHVEPQRMPLWGEDELLDMLVVIKFIKKIPRDFRPARSFCS